MEKPAQDQCGPERIPSLRKMEKSQGLQHAHNFYAQIFTETGIGGLILATGITLAGFRHAWRQHSRATLGFTLPLMIYLTLVALGITYWQVMMINQVGSPEKVNLESASKKGDPLEPAARSSRCSYLRLQWHGVNTPTAFIDQEKA